MKDPHAFFAWHPPRPHETSGAKTGVHPSLSNRVNWFPEGKPQTGSQRAPLGGAQSRRLSIL